MKIEPIGKVANLDELDFEPLTVPVVGYTDNLKEVITDIRFRAVVPPGFGLDMISDVDKNGNVQVAAALRFIQACLLPDDREKWNELIRSDTVNVTSETVSAVYHAIGEFYAKRPFTKQPGSRNGRGSTDTTSPGAASSRKSVKKNSH